jgi:leucyl/phenylalanyl-tRNA--protein transferase
MIGTMPVEPPPSTFAFPDADAADERGRVIVGGDLEPGTLLAAYRRGLFPMRQGDGELAWWSPDPRGVLMLDGLRVSRSLRRAARAFRITVDTAFEAVVAACAERGADEYAWITDEIRAAYLRLHRLGWAHSVEAWTADELVGGLYGVAVGGVFAGESMFHRRPDASKAALVGLVELLGRAGNADRRVIDVQWLTPHLASLGATDFPRPQYLAVLRTALALPAPTFASS